MVLVSVAVVVGDGEVAATAFAVLVTAVGVVCCIGNAIAAGVEVTVVRVEGRVLYCVAGPVNGTGAGRSPRSAGTADPTFAVSDAGAGIEFEGEVV